MKRKSKFSTEAVLRRILVNKRAAVSVRVAALYELSNPSLYLLRKLMDRKAKSPARLLLELVRRYKERQLINSASLPEGTKRPVRSSGIDWPT